MTDDRIAALESELAKAQAEADRWRSDYRELQALHSSVAARVMGSDYELTQAKAELVALKSRENPVTRLHNICNALSNELRDSPYTEDEWRRVDCQVAELNRELAAVKAALNLTTHKLITCGVAADHPDARLAHTKAYADKWDSPQAQSVRKLRAERDALRADAERYRWLRDNHETNTVAGGIVYEVTGRHWNDAIDTAMSAARAQQPGGRGEG